jgi:hypothetical protein
MSSEERQLSAFRREMLLWDGFVESLRESNRYVPHNAEYIQALLAECKAHTGVLKAGTELFRGRLHPPNQEIDEALPLSEMGMPPPDHRTEGRVNPSGIPCFYAALGDGTTDFGADTAIAELRPWPTARVTVARFRLARSCQVIDLRGGTRGWVLTAADLAGHMFSRPAHREDRWVYLGTQYLAERLKADGAAGIVYESTLKLGGSNVALFSSDDLTPLDCRLYAVTYVRVDAERRGEYGEYEDRM